MSQLRNSLVSVNSHVLIHEAESVNPQSQGPSVVLLFGWNDAKLAHIIKYAEIFNKLYPDSAIVIIKSTTTLFWFRQKTRNAIIAPVADLLKKLQEDKTRFRGVLLHVLSNGGGLQLVTLKKLLEKTTSPLPKDGPSYPTALILDSLPSSSGTNVALAMAAPPNPIMRVISVPPIVLLYYVTEALALLNGNPLMFRGLRDTLNSPNIIPSITDPTSTTETPRVYMYSQDDQVTNFAEVEEHFTDAISKGFIVRAEQFENSGHVVHARTDPQRYWKAVQKTWNDAVRAVRNRSREAKL